MQLWAEVLEEGRGTRHPRRKKKESSELLRAANARWARQAVQHGRYEKSHPGADFQQAGSSMKGGLS